MFSASSPAFLLDPTSLDAWDGGDPVLEALDQQEVTLEGRQWRVTVYSVFREAGRRWVQLGLDGPSHAMATIELPGEPLGLPN